MVARLGEKAPIGLLLTYIGAPKSSISDLVLLGYFLKHWWPLWATFHGYKITEFE